MRTGGARDGATALRRALARSVQGGDGDIAATLARMAWARRGIGVAPEVPEALSGIGEDLLTSPEAVAWAYAEHVRPAHISTVAEIRRRERRVGAAELRRTSRVSTEASTAEFLAVNGLGALVAAMHGAPPRASSFRVVGADRARCEPRPVASLRVIDPCVGPGHLLLAAFDVLVGAYERERHLVDRGRLPRRWRVDAPDVPALILTRNLFGADVDAQALVVAAEALALAAWDAGSRERRLPANLSVLTSDLGVLDDRSGVLGGGFDAVLVNPPYCGFRQLDADFRTAVRAAVPRAADDVCTAFVDRCFDLVAPGGVVAAVTPAAWLASRGGHAARRRALEVGHPRIVAALGQRVFPSAPLVFAGALVLDRVAAPDGARVAQIRPERAGPAALEAVCRSPRWVGRDVIERLDLAPLCVALSDGALARRAGTTSIGLVARARDGIWPRDDCAVRWFWELPGGDDGWRRASAGQGYARWYAGTGIRMRGDVAEAWGGDVAVAAVEYGRVAGGRLSARLAPAGSTPRAGVVRIVPGHPDDGSLEAMLAVMNTPIGTGWLRTFGAGLNFNPGAAAAIPLPPLPVAPDIRGAVRALVALKRRLSERRPACDEFAGLTNFPGSGLIGMRDEFVARVWEPAAEILRRERALERRVLDALGVASNPAPGTVLPSDTPFEAHNRRRGAAGDDAASAFGITTRDAIFRDALSETVAVLVLRSLGHGWPSWPGDRAANGVAWFGTNAPRPAIRELLTASLTQLGGHAFATEAEHAVGGLAHWCRSRFPDVQRRLFRGHPIVWAFVSREGSVGALAHAHALARGGLAEIRVGLQEVARSSPIPTRGAADELARAVDLIGDRWRPDWGVGVRRAIACFETAGLRVDARSGVVTPC